MIHAVLRLEPQQKRIDKPGWRQSPANIMKADTGSGASRFISPLSAALGNNEVAFGRARSATRLPSARPLGFVLILSEALLLRDPNRAVAKILPGRFGCLEKC